MKPQPAPGHAARVSEIDALRGVAALAVVLFHYTTQFGVMFPGAPQMPLQVAHGHFGVNLFFIISGFVIFMTLDRTRSAMDFVVSRFSRLYPAYWVSVMLTFLLTHWLGLPGKLVDGSTAIANLLMFHNLFRVPHVDGVYWTLEVELLFYGWMLLLFVLRQLDRLFLLAGALLALRWVYWAAAQWAGVDLPYIVWRLLILDHLPWFVLGLSTHALLSADPSGYRHRQAGWLAAAAVLTLAVTAPPGRAVLSLAFFAIAYGAASGRLPMLRLPRLVWLGGISYPLYLLHENIGWSLLLRLTDSGWSPWLALPVTLALSLGLAHAVSRTVEQPAMRWVRQRWKLRLGRAASA